MVQRYDSRLSSVRRGFNSRLLRQERITYDKKRRNERKWPEDLLIDGLQFPKRVTTSLKKYFNRHNIIQFSLKELMDFIIPEQELHPKDFLMTVPALREKWIGRKTYSSLVHHLSQQDLGHSFNNKWAKRVKKMVQHL